MKFIYYLFPVCAIINGSVSLCIPPGQWEPESRELARPNMPPISSDCTHKKSWSSHMVEPRVQKHAMLRKRTTDEESPDSQEDVNEGTNAGRGTVTYTSEQLKTYRQEYNAAKRASQNLRATLHRAMDAGLEVSQDDLNELSRLGAVAYQQRLVLRRAEQGQPLDLKTKALRMDVASLMQDPEIQERAKAGPYDAQQLAEYKQKFLEALRRLNSRKKQLAQTAEVRKVTKAEEKEVADLQRAYNLQRKMWNRVREGKPSDYRFHRPKQNMDDLLENPKLHKIAQSSGYSVEELAEAKRRQLKAHNAARSLQSELSQVEKVRQLTDDETARLQTLRTAAAREKRMFNRMSKGRHSDGDAALLRKGPTALMQDAEVQRIAQLGGYSLEEVAVQKRGFLDAKYEYLAAQKLISAIMKERRTLTREEDEQLTKIDDVYHLQKVGWERMSKGERLDPAIPPPPKHGRLGKDVAALRPKAKVDEMARPVTQTAQHRVTYTPQQVAMYDQRHLDALDELLAFQDKISAVERPMTAEEEDQLKKLRDVYNQRRAEWGAVQQSFSVDGRSQDARSVTYTADQVAAYNQAHLDALSKLRALDNKMAAADHLPTADDKTQRRALKDDYNEKKKIWIRARGGKPVDRKVYSRRAGSVAKSAESQESRPGSQTPPSKTEVDHSTNQPLLMATHRLLAPVLTPASHFLHGLGRQWRAMPWNRYLAHPRVNIVTPAELLRAEPAL